MSGKVTVQLIVRLHCHFPEVRLQLPELDGARDEESKGHIEDSIEDVSFPSDHGSRAGDPVKGGRKQRARS